MQVPLTQRPLSADVEATYDRMHAEVRTAVAAVVPGLMWLQYASPLATSCEADGSYLGGRAVILASWSAAGGIPDDLWPAAVEAMVAVIAPYGFGRPQTTVGSPGNHLIEATGPFGAFVELGTQVNATLRVRTGCHPE